MDLYEYQGKQFFASYGIPVSDGRPVQTVDDAVAAAERPTEVRTFGPASNGRCAVGAGLGDPDHGVIGATK